MKPTNPLKQMPSLRELDKQNKHIHLMLSLIMIVLSALGQTFVMQVFMDPCNLISGGFTGIALFMQKVLARIGIPFSTSVGILMLNVPAAIWAYKRISKRFVMLTAIQFTLVSLFLEIFTFTPLVEDKVLNILFGGIGWGFTIALALRAGGSTGGTDFIAQYVSTKLHKSIFEYVFYANCVMYVLYGFSFGWMAAGYSILFQFLSTKS
ncbi:YitT family protein, partial [Faecalibaculum rodentium]